MMDELKICGTPAGEFHTGQFVRLKGEDVIRVILMIRGDEAFLVGADSSKTGFVDLDKLEVVPEEELDKY